MGRSRSWWIAVAIVVTAVALALPIVAWATSTSSGAHNRGVVMFVGDSNITFSAQVIVDALTSQQHVDNSYTPVLVSHIGVSIRYGDCRSSAPSCATNNYWQIKMKETVPKVNADIYVNDLGINDTASAGTATTRGYEYYGQKIDWFMRLLPPSKTVLWTNLPCQVEPPDRSYGCQRVNYALSVAKNRWSNLVVLDWASIANLHPEFMKGGSDLTAVHYTLAGQSAWTAFVLKELDARLPAPQ
jgi:hypothetical protein